MTKRLRTMTASDTKALVFDNVVTLDGQVVGTWKRTTGRGKTTTVDLRFLTTLTAPERQAISIAVERYQGFWAPQTGNP